MKKYLITATLFFLIFNSFYRTITVFALPVQEKAAISFSDLGLSADIVMHGPFDVDNFRFNLPATWLLQEGSQINLIASSYFASSNPSLAVSDQPGSYIGALLDVYFNGHLQKSIALKAGENVPYQVSVSQADLASTNQDGSLEISFYLNASLDCTLDSHHTTVVITSDSQIGANYTLTEPVPDLRRLPWPLYQARATVRGDAYVVVPSSPSSDEIQAALITMATFGRMTQRNLPLKLLSVDDLSNDIRQKADLIFVGKPEAFSMLPEVTFPVSFSSTGFADIQQDDGVVQQAISPWNNTKMILLISGNKDVGILKAARAFSTSSLITGDSPSYSIISKVNASTLSNILSVDAAPIQTSDVPLSDLGYKTETLSDIGTNYFTFRFIIPPGYKPAESPYLNLNFSHSTLINSERSEAVVFLNDVIVGGIKLSSDNSNSVSFDVKLPASAFHSGINTLDIAFSLIPSDECSAKNLDGLWVTVSEDSILHLPLVQAVNTGQFSLDLDSYPLPFSNDPSLGTTAFILPKGDRKAWETAGSVAFDLGGLAAGPIFQLETAFDGQIPDEAKKRNLILVGQPKDLTIVSEMKDSMPAYFEAGSNIAVLETQQVLYRVSPDKKLGYLELFPSLWTDNTVIFGIFGTTDDGISDALKALLTPKTHDVLRGDFITVDGDKPLIVDTRTGLGTGRLSPELGAVVATENLSTPVPLVKPSPQNNKSQILLGLIGTGGLILVIALVALLLRRRNV
jgi:hypothetical protein